MASRGCVAQRAGRRVRSNGLVAVWLLVIVLGLDGTALAQSETTDGTFLFGPLSLTPTLALKDLGFDTNVFNDPLDQQQDFTMTLAPEVDAALRLGSARLTGAAAMDFVFYQDSKSEESANGRYDVGVDVRLMRIRPFATARFVRTRERPGFEIDTRARRRESRFTVGTEADLTGTTSVSVAARRSRYLFDEGERFAGTELPGELNRTSEAADLSLRVGVTPLTTVVFRGEVERVDFEEGLTRDANIFLVSPGLEFEPAALLKGSVFVGLREFRPRDAQVPSYRGIMASVGLTYDFRERTRVDVQFSRDVDYSADRETPYYLNTGGGLTITQRIFGPFDVRARGTRHRLSYRALEGLDALQRFDTITIVGGGVGYRVGASARVGIDAEYWERVSTLQDREYDRLRVVASITYGSF